MDNLNRYRAQLKEIGALIDKLDNGSLELNELKKLEELTRAIHERSIILKYKMFEGEAQKEEAATVVIQEEPKPEEKVEPELEEEPEEIDFSMFEAPEIPEDSEPEEVTEEVEEPVQAEVEEEDEFTEEEEQVGEESTTEDGLEFWQKIDVIDDSLGTKFADSKLDSLVGAFSLNEKLRYINDLFDGSSELFSDAVKALDSFENIDSAHNRFSDLANEHNWDPEDEAVVEFMSFVRRRYA